MIQFFKIENFRSVKNPLKIDLTTEKRLIESELPYNTFIQNKDELLKSLLLYGRNASGKSNALLALKALSYLIENSDTFKHGDKLEPYEPFLFDKACINKPVRFEIKFISIENKIKYKYVLSYNANEILFEALYIYPSGVKAKLYERTKTKITYGEYYKGTKKSIEKDLLPNQLFLSKSSTSKVKYLNECYLYFSRYVYVSTIHDTEYDKSIIRSFSELLKNDNKLKQNLLELLKTADTSISDFKIIENEKAIKFPDTFSDDIKKQILEKYKYEVLTKHSIFENGKEIGKTSIDFENESFGTKKLFTIGALILDTLDDGGVIVIDELDKGLHPLLSKLLIKLFNSKKNNPNNAQLIFATHDSTLLDLDLLRRDQICFIDKEFEECSISYKLSDIKGVRKDMPIDKWYLSGRFKAIPVITEPNLKF
ncbi:MAG: ATP-binding protein [Bacteroidota bacterium]|nr:ATP-binding protein [Bacteroidota bacterium]